jgi:hypothetical protein
MLRSFGALYLHMFPHSFTLTRPFLLFELVLVFQLIFGLQLVLISELLLCLELIAVTVEILCRPDRHETNRQQHGCSQSRTYDYSGFHKHLRNARTGATLLSVVADFPPFRLCAIRP